MKPQSFIEATRHSYFYFLFFNLVVGLTFKRAIASTHDSFGCRLLTPGRRVKVIPFHKYEFIFHAHVFEI